MALLTLATALLSLTTTATSQSITPPTGCPLPTWEVTTFNWYNGSKSLDCIHNAADIATKGCLCAGTGGWCSPDGGEAGCKAQGGSWVNVCYTGMPNYEPWGYGPAQHLSFEFADGLSCGDQYIGYRVHDIGNGESNCGYADRGQGRIVSFYGSSNEDVSTGRMDYVLGSGHALTCANGSQITYSGSVEFELDCVHDAFFNATCTAEPFEIPVLSYEWV
ncbi:hypothetical protein BDW74DRAFT_164069 [Aspergillus multicolor]|uniref:uncharacterized protein n=1 Tax=Aspergillus multicolor TaxID=41759 RepID=UPI003CCD0926